MSVDLPLPMPTGRATSMVGAPADASASAPSGSQDMASVFDSLMAALGPVAVSGDAGVDDANAVPPAAPVPQGPDGQADTVAPQPSATAALPQLIADLQSVPPGPVTEAPAPVTPQIAAPPIIASPIVAAPVVVANAVDKSAATIVAEAPAKPAPAIDIAAATQGTPADTELVQVAPQEAPVRPAAPKLRAAAADETKAADTDSNDKAPLAVTADATVPPAVVAQVQAQSQTQTQAQTQTQIQPPAQAPKTSQSRPSAPLVAPRMPAPVLADAAAAVASTPAPVTDQPKTSDAKAPDTASTDAATTGTATSQTAAPGATPALVQPQPKPADALAGTLKAVRKAVAGDADVQAASAPRTQAPSAFSLQAQVEAPGAYTASGAQSAGTTQAGSNLARATVETLSSMAVQVNRKLSEGNTKFALELHPADLGKVEVTLSIARDGTTSAHLKFDTPVTAAAFQAHEGELRNQLAQSGLNLDSGALTFSSRDDGNLAGGNSGGSNQAFAQMQQDQQSQNRQNQNAQSARAFQNASTVASDADVSAAIDAGLLAQRAGLSSTLALNLIV